MWLYAKEQRGEINMTTVLDILGTSTPVSEVVAQKLGLVRAAIVCRVFFYQRLKDGVCRASVATFAKSLGLSVGAISSNLTWLLENGWIENTEPLVKGKRPNHYKVTKKFLKLVAPSDSQRSANERNVQQVNVNVQQVKEKEDIKEDIKEEVLPKGSAPAPAYLKVAHLRRRW
jgi:predicted transcriptional regulator